MRFRRVSYTIDDGADVNAQAVSEVMALILEASGTADPIDISPSIDARDNQQLHCKAEYWMQSRARFQLKRGMLSIYKPPLRAERADDLIPMDTETVRPLYNFCDIQSVTH